MGIENYNAGPRVSIADTDNGDAIELPIFPESLEHTSEAVWQRQSVPGLSHQRNQFTNTNNAKFAFAIFVDDLDGVTTTEEVTKIYNFLDSMQFPAEGKGASKYLLAWPGVASIVIISATITFTQTRYSQQDGTLRAFTAKFAVEEHRDVRITKEEVRSRGLFRAGGNGALR